MTRAVPADKIEAIVGVNRDPVEHYGLALDEELVFYILHSGACRDSSPDSLHDCPFSLALDLGIDRDLFPDYAVPLRILADNHLAPKEPW